MTDQDRTSSEQSRDPAAPAPEESVTEPSDADVRTAETADTQPGTAAGAALSAGSSNGPASQRRLLAALAMLLAIAAAAAAGFSWWHYRQLAASVQAAGARTRAALQQQQGSLDSLSDKLNGLRQQTQQRLQQHKRRVDALEQRLQPLPGRVAQLQSQLEAVQGGSAEVRATWLRAEARYYLRVADTRLQLAHDWHGAVEALNLADGRLRALADPGLAPVRRSIAREIAALQAVQLPDIDGLTARLDALAGRADKLPLRAAAPTSFDAHAPPAGKTQPGLGRFWAAIKRALASLVRVRRREQPVRRALTDEQRALLRGRFAVELQLAEVAAVRRRPAAFRAHLDAARRLLTEDFDASDAAVAAAKQALTQMRGIDIAPSPPDISQSLARLRAAGSGI